MSWTGSTIRSIPALLHESKKYRAVFINNNVLFEIVSKDYLNKTIWLKMCSDTILYETGKTAPSFEIMLSMKDEIEALKLKVDEQSKQLETYERNVG